MRRIESWMASGLVAPTSIWFFVAVATSARSIGATELSSPVPSSTDVSAPPAGSPLSDAEPSNPLSDTDARSESRRHFQSGLNLYEDKNYAAALAEFEAAYRQYPSASALQNVALCQKQLYRYSEARESLTRLIRAHSSELDARERAAIETAITELASLVGSVRVSVVPADAQVLLDGRSVSRDDLGRAIVLDVGEHRVTAEASGFAPASLNFRIAGGHTDVPIALNLTETTGTVVVIAPDPQTAIAVDGRPVAFAEWTGRLEPGRHFVQVYREGYEPFEEEIDVEIGQTLRVRGILGDRIEAQDRNDTTTDPYGRGRRPIGYYGLLGIRLFTPRGHPLGFEPSSSTDWGWSLGLRVGYRLIPQLGLEAEVDSSSFDVHGHCTNPTPSACPNTAETGYHLDARRFGAALRLFSSSDTLRLTSAMGGGFVSHDFRDRNNKAAGLDPYLLLEAGVQANWRHSLWELVATASFDGASSIHFGDYRPYAEANGIQMFGMALRVGWGEWTPSRAPLPPMPPTVPVKAKQ